MAARWFVVALLISVVSGAQAVRAQATDEDVDSEDATPASTEVTRVARAEEHAEAGYAAFSRGEYTLAAAEYLRALEAAPSGDIVYNLARIYDTKLRDRRRAAEYYRRYTQEPGADAERLHVAAERLLALREQAQIVGPRATSTPSAADAAVLQQDPAQANDNVHGDASSHGAKPAHAHGLTGTQTVGVVLGALGVAGLATGLGFGLAAKVDADMARRSCDGNACTTQRGVDVAQRGNRMAMVSTIAFSAGGALLLVGAGLVLLGGGHTEHAHNSDAHPAHRTLLTQITPWAGPTGLGVQVASAF